MVIAQMLIIRAIYRRNLFVFCKNLNYFNTPVFKLLYNINLTLFLDNKCGKSSELKYSYRFNNTITTRIFCLFCFS